MLYRLLPALIGCAFQQQAFTQNYIHYHQRSLVVQEHIARGEHEQALALLNTLERDYRMMPTETFARAVCLASVGDTAAARRAYLRTIEQRAPFIWMDLTKPRSASAQDSLWYAGVEKECIALWRTIPRYADGPIPGMPTPVTDLNTRHQQAYDHPVPEDHHKAYYAALIAEHDALFMRFVNGGLPVPSIADYGINEEFSTFVFHCSPELTTAHEKAFKNWLEAGLIYPILYATPFDDLANQRNEPFPYGIFNGLTSNDLLPGHEERRALIGMGDERLEGLRFNRPTASE